MLPLLALLALQSPPTAPVQRIEGLPPDLESLGYAVAVVRDPEQRKQVAFAISAPRESPAGPVGMDHGRVFLIGREHRPQVRVLDGRDGFGFGLDWLGDIDGDSWPDFVSGQFYNGVVAVSGADGHRLWSTEGSSKLGKRGTAIADIDCDRVRDLVTIEPTELPLRRDGTPGPAQQLRAWSGATGFVIAELEVGGRGFTAGPVDVGDVDGDLRADLAFLSEEALGGGRVAVTLDVVRAADFAEVLRLPIGDAGGPTGWPEFVDGDAKLGALGDIDGDGAFEVVIGLVERDSPLRSARGRVHAFDVRRRRILWTHLCLVDDERMSCVAAGGSDIDGDGAPDVLVREIRPHFMDAELVGRLAVLSGRSGELIRAHLGPSMWAARFPHCAEFVGDMDDDGFDEYLTTETCGAYDVAGAREKVRVFSGKTGAELMRFP
ncbi:MAG: hypothetical protein HZA52_21720 [Planctomycetes bacterium]|nr:hypothetical protein [Planctomycetota bacterium]